MLWVKGVPVQQFPPPGLRSDLASHRRSSSCRLPYANLSWKEQPRGGERQGSICEWIFVVGAERITKTNNMFLFAKWFIT